MRRCYLAPIFVLPTFCCLHFQANSHPNKLCRSQYTHVWSEGFDPSRIGLVRRFRYNRSSNSITETKSCVRCPRTSTRLDCDIPNRPETICQDQRTFLRHSRLSIWSSSGIGARTAAVQSLFLTSLEHYYVTWHVLPSVCGRHAAIYRRNSREFPPEYWCGERLH